MTTQTATDNLLGDYQLRLPAFEGPLDVLLRLIERSELAITDVSLVAVSDQFLAYLETLNEASAETVAEFAAIGARLVLLKSRSLLPRPEPAEIEEDPSDLVRQLVEYRAYKNASRLLGTRDANGSAAFAAGSVATPTAAAPPKLAPYGVTVLTRALRRRLATSAEAPGVMPLKPVVTLREMIERVLTVLRGNRTLTFRALLKPNDDRGDVLTAFLAVLVLVRRQIVEAKQPSRFGEITLSASSPHRPSLQTEAAHAAADD